MSRKPAPAPA